MGTKRTEYPDITTMSRDELLALEPGTTVQHDLGFGQRLLFRRSKDGDHGSSKVFQLVGTYVSLGVMQELTGTSEDREEKASVDTGLSSFETSWPLS